MTLTTAIQDNCNVMSMLMQIYALIVIALLQRNSLAILK